MMSEQASHLIREVGNESAEDQNVRETLREMIQTEGNGALVLQDRFGITCAVVIPTRVQQAFARSRQSPQ